MKRIKGYVRIKWYIMRTINYLRRVFYFMHFSQVEVIDFPNSWEMTSFGCIRGRTIESVHYRGPNEHDYLIECTDGFKVRVEIRSSSIIE